MEKKRENGEKEERKGNLTSPKIQKSKNDNKVFFLHCKVDKCRWYKYTSLNSHQKEGRGGKGREKQKRKGREMKGKEEGERRGKKILTSPVYIVRWINR